MKRKFIAYAMLPMMGAGLLAMNPASAHALFGLGAKATAEEIATRQQTMFQQEADLLGLSVDDIKKGWAEGKNLTEIAQEHGITQEQLKQKMKDAQTARMKTELQALVDKGVITRAQADQRLKAMETRATGKKMPMGMFGRGGAR